MSHPVDPTAAAAAGAARWRGAPPQAVVGPPPPSPVAGAAWWEPRTLKVHLPAGWARGLAFALWLFFGLDVLGYERDAPNAETVAMLWTGGFVLLGVIAVATRLRLGGHITIDPGRRLVHWRRPRDFGPVRTWSFDEVTGVLPGALQESLRLQVGGRRFRLDPEPTAVPAVAALAGDLQRRTALARHAAG